MSEKNHAPELEFVGRLKMNRKKLIVKWSPHAPHDTFAILGQDVRVYQVDWKLTSPPHPSLPTRRVAAGIRLLGTNTSVAQSGPVRCAAWSPSEKGVLAFGLPTGKVVVTAVANDRVGVKNPSLEFAPKHSRTCNALAWNPAFPELIAAGYVFSIQETLILLFAFLFSFPLPPLSVMTK